MTILRDALIDSRRKNIERYTRLLATKLMAHERKYTQKRIAQERAELDKLIAQSFRDARAARVDTPGAATAGALSV
jgi:hypothetical protein